MNECTAHDHAESEQNGTYRRARSNDFYVFAIREFPHGLPRRSTIPRGM